MPALCAGEIKKVGFQVDASVNASAANFPIPNIYSRSRFTLAISIIAICSRVRVPIIVADTRGPPRSARRGAYVYVRRVITRANCTTLCGRRDIVRARGAGAESLHSISLLPREVFITLLGDFIKAIKITFLSLSRVKFDPNRRNLRKRCRGKFQVCTMGF